MQVIYKVNRGLELYIDNVLNGEVTDAQDSPSTTERSGHIVIGRYFDESNIYGIVAVDWLTIWERALTKEERDLAHLD